MRVIKTEGSDQEDWTICLRTHHGQPYAILSHRWSEDPNHEILFADIDEIDEYTTQESITIVKNAQYTGINPSTKPAFKKLKGAARQALNDGYGYLWADTCCIDKNSSAELSEAINSMWTWYESSSVCLVYLFDVPTISDKSLEASFPASKWWTRGWTLQELLAPNNLIFFSSEWSVLGTKKYMDLTISRVTGIDANIINGTINLDSICIAQRMSWMSNRVTTRVEDTAYCLLGIFGVNMPLLYGEGELAFIRLQEEIMKSSDDETIFAWRDDSLVSTVYSGLLAQRPAAFKMSRRIVRYDNSECKDLYSMTNKGLSLTSRSMCRFDEHEGLYCVSFHCADPELRQKNVSVYLKKISATSEQYARIRCHEFALISDEHRSRMYYSEMVYVKQFHNQQPVHAELDPSKNRIRLLQVIPSENPSTIKVRLMEADIRTSRYAAVSQHWGAEARTCTIWVNEEPFQIKKGLFRFLQKACEELSDDLFWVYSICVQTGDDKERSHHVTLYTQIFMYASRVVIWLGSVDTDYNGLRHLLQAVMTNDPDDQVFDAYAASTRDVHEAFTTNLTALQNIANHPYWRRAWIVQEVLSARELIVDMDTFSINMGELTCLYHIIINSSDTALHVDMSHMGQLLDLCQSRRPHLVATHGLSNHKSAWTSESYKIEDLLAMFQHWECADIRDRVYAFANLSELSQRLPFDYLKSTFDVFDDVVTCLGSTLSLTVLSRLVLALELNLDACETDSANDNHCWHRHGSDVSHIFEHMASSAFDEILTDEALRRRGFTDVSVSGSMTHLVSVFGAESKYGIVFADPQLRTVRSVYKPLCLYTNPTMSKFSLHSLPSNFSKALAHTFAVKKGSDTGSSPLQIAADRLGLLALGLCVQANSRHVPRAFEGM